MTDRIYWGVGILARFVNRTIPSSHPAMSKSQRATWADTMSAPGSSSRSIAPRARCWEPCDREIAVHEYQLHATTDPAVSELASVLAVARVLPYDECPLAALNVERLVGAPLAGLRSEVLVRLPGILGCTHLNDALRALAEVPILAAALVGVSPRAHQGHGG